jgi:cytoskeletal protein CcmA (bactofilin family)
MATYVNDLRLKEIGTGESSGTWGTETNTNLELIGEALGYGTEGITTNADTHTTTVADGSTDPGRAMYIKYTGTLDSACTITIAPNTMSRVHFIENATSGSQNIIISQGSGANVTIPAGDVKAVYLDGAGSGAAVVDAFASLNVVDLKVQDDLTVTDDVSIGGDLDVDGTTNLDAVDIDGAVQADGTITVGVDDTGYDVKFFGATSGAYMLWDESADDLKLVGAAGLTVAGDVDVDGTTNLDAVDIDGSVQIDATVTVGVDDTGYDVKFFGATASAYMLWDASADDLKLVGAAGMTVAGDIDVDGTANLDVVDIDGAVDMASTLQVDGAITSSAGATITVADNSDNLTLTSTDADANAGPNLRLYRNSSSPADSDLFGQIDFEGRNDNSQDFVAAQISSASGDVSDGSEDGEVRFDVMTAGTLREYLRLASGSTPSVIINQDSQDIDFQVQSDGDANALHVTGDKYGIGIGTTSYQSYNAYRGIDIGQQGSIYANNAGDDIAFGANFYLKADGNWAYKTTAVVGMWQMDGNVLRFYDAASGTANNNISLTTRLRIDSEGIKFGTNTAAANALDVYEEGTWTGNITTSDTDFTTTSRGSDSRYTRIGDTVTCWFAVSIASPTGGSGAIRLSGLPYACNSTVGARTGLVDWGRTDNVASNQVFGTLPTDSDVITFYYLRDANTSTSFSASNMNGQVTPFFTGRITYKV